MFDFDFIDEKKANLTIERLNYMTKWGIYNKNIDGTYDYWRGSYGKVTDQALADIQSGIQFKLDSNSNLYFMIAEIN